MYVCIFVRLSRQNWQIFVVGTHVYPFGNKAYKNYFSFKNKFFLLQKSNFFSKFDFLIIPRATPGSLASYILCVYVVWERIVEYL